MRRREIRRFGALTLDERNLAVEPTLENARILARGAAAFGIDRLNWSKAQRQLRERVAFLRQVFTGAFAGEENPWPDLSEAALAENPEEWLAPFILGRQKLDDIDAENFDAALAALIPWELARRLEAEAPTHFVTPAGSTIALDYGAAEGPVLAARVQEFYGLSTHPSLAGGRVRADLAAFVAGASPDPDHPRPAGVLARLLGGGEGGNEGALSAPSLAGRPGSRRADHPRQAARNLIFRMRRKASLLRTARGRVGFGRVAPARGAGRRRRLRARPRRSANDQSRIKARRAVVVENRAQDFFQSAHGLPPFFFPMGPRNYIMFSNGIAIPLKPQSESSHANAGTRRTEVRRLAEKRFRAPRPPDRRRSP